MGVKKSVVKMRARSSSKRYAAASSPSTAPTSKSPLAGCKSVPNEANMLSSLASGSLHAQPAPGESDVSLTDGCTGTLISKLHYYMEECFNRADGIRTSAIDTDTETTGGENRVTARPSRGRDG
jgi:hypothetical protein